MLVECKTQSIWFISIGFVLQILGTLLQVVFNSYRISPLFLCAGTGSLYVGCSACADGKGWHRAWGLLGLLGLPGVIIVLCLKDRYGGPV